MSLPIESPKSHKTVIRKRRYRHLERHNIDEIFDPLASSSSSYDKDHSKKKDRKSIKLNEKMLRRASATVDLISQKVKSKNLI